MDATIRCKMRVYEVTRSIDPQGNVANETVKLQAVTGADGTPNSQWSKWTPSAQFSITINSPEAHGKLANGHEFYVDFIQADEK